MSPDSVDDVRTLDDLRRFIHATLCAKENLHEDQFRMTEMVLVRRGQRCGLQFSLQGPRAVRLGAIRVAEKNDVYYYDARGERYLKLWLRH